MALSDPWAVVGPESRREEAPASWPRSSAPAGRRGRSYIVVAVLYLAASAMHLVWLAIAPSGRFEDPHVYAFPQLDANKVYVTLLFAAIGALVLIRRSRVFALGLAIALPVQWLATDPNNFRPSLFAGPADQRTAAFVFFSAESATMVAAAVAVFALRELLRHEPPAARAERAQRLRIRALCLGWGALLGGGLWLIAGIMSWRVDHYGLPELGPLHTYYCCNFNADNGFDKAGVLGDALAMAGFSVAAAFVRSRGLSVAWLLGPSLFAAAGLPEAVARAILPAQSLLGWSVAQRDSNYLASTTLLPGFWLALGGLLVAVAAAVVRLRLGRPADFFNRS